MSASDDDRSDAPAGADEPERIQRRIEETRSHMTDTLTALEQKLSARQLTDNVIDAVRTAVIGTGDGSNDMIDMVKRNPIPAALAGIGIGWMIFGSRPPRRSKPASTSPGMASRVGSVTERVASRVGETASSYAGQARTLADATQSRATRAANRVIEDNPLAVGLVGLVLGATIGALLPMTRREGEWLGAAHTHLVDQAGELGREALDRARTVAEAAGEAAVGVVEREFGVANKKAAGGGTPTSH
jgi:hypothetical protein